jgi:hypothetical protein
MAAQLDYTNIPAKQGMLYSSRPVFLLLLCKSPWDAPLVVCPVADLIVSCNCMTRPIVRPWAPSIEKELAVGQDPL